MRVAVIINPVAGAGGGPRASRRRVALATEVLAAEGVAADVQVTARAGHAFDLAREAAAGGASLVVAWGGDGTVNEVGRALAFGAAALGIVPAGSGNGLARELGVPRRPADALRAALGGTERTIDAGELGGWLFFNVAGVGLDARVAARVDARASRRRGPLPYVAITVHELLTYRPRSYTIDVDGDVVQRRGLIVAFANGRQYGNGATVAPRARVDDGALDLVVVEGRSPLANVWAARRLFTGDLASAPGVLMRPFKHVQLTGDEPLEFHVDGEPRLGGLRLIARVHPGALRVRHRSPHATGDGPHVCVNR